MRITNSVVREIIRKLLNNDAYGVEVSNLLNAQFMQYAIDFFKKVAIAKLNSQPITSDWYKAEMLNPSLSNRELAINSGTNEKTISNNFDSGRREIIIEGSQQHYDKLYHLINELVDSNEELSLTLTIKLNGVAVDLDINESLIVISSLAAKRDALNGGLWSTTGKRVEKPLMLTLCHIFSVSERNYAAKIKAKDKKPKKKGAADVETNTDFEREIDFYLISGENQFKCEVKLMSKGNPESADAVIARGSRVFVANKLSDTNKTQLNSLGVEWVELRSEGGYKRFTKVLQTLDIPYTDFNGDINERLDEIFREIF
jgi:hypothetical protein